MAGPRDKFELDLLHEIGVASFDKLRKIEADKGFFHAREAIRFAIGLYDHSAPNPVPGGLRRVIRK